MRLFIAVCFNDHVKRRLTDTQNRLREVSLRGHFTARDHLHLTLVFLGEATPGRVEDLRMVMQSTSVPPFELQISGIGRFPREGGDIWWMGVEQSPSLSVLHGQLTAGVSAAGFAVENRRFTPHLTLARALELPPGFDRERFSRETEIIAAQVTHISLVKSERIGGRLVYTPLFQHPLSQQRNVSL